MPVVFKKGKAMFCPFLIALVTCLKTGIYIIKDKAGRADQMSCICIIDSTVIQKMMEKSAPFIKGVRRVKIQNRADMCL